ncbi:MAG: C39 family peptidase [Fibrobacteria bacterium]
MRVSRLVFQTVIIVLGAISCSMATIRNLDVLLHRQEGVNWCWAACDHMVREYIGRIPLSQCSIAAETFGAPAACCPTPDGNCDQPSTSHIISNYTATQVRSGANNSLSMTEISTEIDEGRPFIYSKIVGGSNHLMVGIGYSWGTWDAGYIMTNNPYGLGSRCLISYLSYRNWQASSDTKNFYNIRN